MKTEETAAEDDATNENRRRQGKMMRRMNTEGTAGEDDTAYEA